MEHVNLRVVRARMVQSIRDGEDPELVKDFVKLIAIIAVRPGLDVGLGIRSDDSKNEAYLRVKDKEAVLARSSKLLVLCLGIHYRLSGAKFPRLRTWLMDWAPRSYVVHVLIHVIGYYLARVQDKMASGNFELVKAEKSNDFTLQKKVGGG